MYSVRCGVGISRALFALKTIFVDLHVAYFVAYYMNTCTCIGIYSHMNRNILFYVGNKLQRECHTTMS